MELITSETGVTIGVLVLIVGGVVWLTKMWGQERSNARAIKDLGEDHDKSVGSLTERLTRLEAAESNMADRIARIETKIDILIEQLRK